MNAMGYMRVQLDDNAIMPERAHAHDAGIDLFTPIDVTVPAHGYVFIDTGVHVELPPNTDGHIRSKSGLNRFHGLTADGTVDEGYTGTVGVTVHSSNDNDYHFRAGDKIAQLIVEDIRRPSLIRVGKIVGHDRGENGYGSTGR